MKQVWLASALFAALVFAQAPSPEVQEPPEEDVNIEQKKEYTFNPLQASKEMKVGAFYMKKGSYRAAVKRFEEALKWDPNTFDAYLRIGEAYQKLGDAKAARDAWSKYVEAQPDSKEAAALRKKLNKS